MIAISPIMNDTKEIDMRILYFDLNSFCLKDVLDGFTALGHSYVLCELPERARMLGLGASTIGQLYEEIKKDNYHCVFTMNYFPMVSEACQKAGIHYLSLIYDNTYMKGYSINIINSCNYIFTFDSAMYEELAAQGVQTVYYAPMAANPDRIAALTASGNPHQYDISFVGALYNEDHNFYDEFTANAAKNNRQYYIGYVDALIQTQLHLYGTDILTPIPKEIIDAKFASVNEWTETNSYFTTPERIFADSVLCRKITALEREQLLSQLSAVHRVDLFTRDKNASVGSCHNHGYVDYTTEMPKVFAGSRINLNITLKSIRHGIPLRAMEIMGAGGFLLTNYQSDFLMHFDAGKDFVYYEDMNDAVEKAMYYLQHEDERTQIAANGLRKIREAHTYEIRIDEMLSLLR